MRILTAEEMQQEEKRGYESGISYSEMMECAGKNTAELLQKLCKNRKNIVILCGKGRNGGDGFVVARFLAQAGKDVTVVRVFDEPSDALSEEKFACIPPTCVRVVSLKMPEQIMSVLEKAEVLVDAVFGIGFRGALPENIKALFEMCNHCDGMKVALDVPSGLSRESREITCFCADVTVAMHALKPEHVYKPHSFYCGRVYGVDIGFSICSKEKKYAFSENDIKSVLPARPYYANKGTFGRALLVAGSRCMPGAAVIAAKGAIDTGVGLITLATPESCLPAVECSLRDCTFLPLNENETGQITKAAVPKLLQRASVCSAVALGCGLGQGSHVSEAVEKIIAEIKIPLILDADGINAVAGHTDIWKVANSALLLTPHPGEMARLTGKTIAEIEANREEIALRFARENGVYLLLKGADTVVASPNGELYVNRTGCVALARGGSGDLLTGIVLSLLAQGLTPFNALCVGAYIHGLAGEIAEKKYTSFCANIGRITDCLPDAFLQISAE